MARADDDQARQPDDEPSFEDSVSRYSRESYVGRSSKHGAETARPEYKLGSEDKPVRPRRSPVRPKPEQTVVYDEKRHEAALRAREQMDAAAGLGQNTAAYEGKKPRKARLFRKNSAQATKRSAEKGNEGGKRKRRHRPVLVVLAVIVAVFAGWMIYLDGFVHMNDPELAAQTSGSIAPWHPYYMLITGSDSRSDETEGSRTDTIMLARVDGLGRKLTLVSIPRDTKVELDGVGAAKINAAYAYGGPALCTETVSDFADVQVSRYLEVGFEGFTSIVDAVGGVTVDVPENTEYKGVHVPSGIQTLNGEQALVFVRCRKTYAAGDFQRAANQRAFISALAKAVKQAPPWKWPAIINSIAQCVGTDGHAWDLFLILLEAGTVSSENTYSAMVPSTTATIDGVSYVVCEEDAWHQMMVKINQGLDPNE